MIITIIGTHGEHLFNYCAEPAYDINTLVFDVYKALGSPKKRIFHWLYRGGLFWLAVL